MPPCAGGFGGTGVGCGGDAHADEAGQRREHSTKHVGNGPPGASPVEKDQDQDRHDHNEGGNPCVLAADEGHGAFPDGCHQFLHPVVAGIGGIHLPGKEGGQRKCADCERNGEIQPDHRFHGVLPSSITSANRRNYRITAPFSPYSTSRGRGPRDATSPT